MNPWYEELREEQAKNHDQQCEDGASCRTRERHIDSVYMLRALRLLVEDLRAA